MNEVVKCPCCGKEFPIEQVVRRKPVTIFKGKEPRKYFINCPHCGKELLYERAEEKYEKGK